jgi:hypothetical protein
MPFVLTSADLSVGSSVTTCRPRQRTIREKPPRYIGNIVLGMRALLPRAWIETFIAREAHSGGFHAPHIGVNKGCVNAYNLRALTLS